MASLEWDTERSGGVTLVELYVSADGPRRVRVENRLAGPTWPPRREGQPAAGWDGDAFEGLVTADERLVTGYATPAPPEDPPARVVSDEPADPGATAGPVRPGVDEPAGDVLDRPVESTAEGVVRSLGDPVVPRDAVPVPDSDGPSAAVERPGGPAPEDGETGRDSATVDAETDRRSRGTRHGDGPEGELTDAPGSPLVVPGPVRAWLQDVERRMAAVERADSSAATAGLSGAVAADRRALARVARRVETLSGRARRVDDRGRASAGEEP